MNDCTAKFCNELGTATKKMLEPRSVYSLLILNLFHCGSLTGVAFSLQVIFSANYEVYCSLNRLPRMKSPNFTMPVEL
jgi:hypothetical protein